MSALAEVDRNCVLMLPAQRTHTRVRMPVVRLPFEWHEDKHTPIPTDLGLDRCGRRRSRATHPDFSKGRKPGNAGKKYPPQILTPDEIHALIEACGRSVSWRRYVGWIAFEYTSGARVSESLNVHEEDLDRDRHRVLIRRGKGGRSRYVQMTDWGFDMVEAWLEIRRDLPPGPVFCVTNGSTRGEPWTPCGVRSGLHRLRQKAGVTKRVHPHAFRHTLACELMRDGFPLSYIQNALGHLNPATTATYLVNIGAVESLDAVAARPAPAFAVPAVVVPCPSCGEVLAAGERLCGPCLDGLLASLVSPETAGVVLSGAAGSGASACHAGQPTVARAPGAPPLGVGLPLAGGPTEHSVGPPKEKQA